MTLEPPNSATINLRRGERERGREGERDRVREEEKERERRSERERGGER